MTRIGMLVMLSALAFACEEKPAEVKAPPPSVKAEPAKVAVVEPAKAEPAPVDPAKAEPAKAEPAKAEPAKVEPSKAEPAKAEPAKAEPVKAEPAKTEPVKAEPAKVEPPKAEPVKVEPVKAEPPKPAAGARYTLVAIPAPDKKIERLWKSKCSSCHGADGKATTEKGRKLLVSDVTVAAWQTSRTNAELRKAIADGVKTQKDGVAQEMDGYAADLAADQLDALVQYTRWLGAPK